MERSLVERARAGDRDAFETLVRSRVDAVYRTAYTILGDAADAQDATQEAFISAWRGLRGLRDAERFDAWFGRILTNACRMSLRHRSTVREIRMDPGLQEAIPSIDPPEPSTVDADTFDRAFERLPVDQRALLVAHHLEGRSVAELADESGVPVGTIKSRLHSARTALQRALEKRP
jgi:RNA polymerase sigma-70 factor (ECF subfamily)